MIALVPAAGSGTRMSATSSAPQSGHGPKQYLPLAGRPVLWHAVRAVCVPPVQSVFVVLSPGDRQFGTYDWSAFAGRVQPLFCGGETRRDSVFNGLVALMTDLDADEWVLVHDAARPCLPPQDLAQLIAQCEGDEVGGLLAFPVAETVKKAAKDESGAQRVAGTEDRSQLWLAQTPQMFRAALLARALKEAKSAVTDEASAVEQLGLRPRLVAGSRENIKVTYPEDMAIAESILARRAKGAP